MRGRLGDYCITNFAACHDDSVTVLAVVCCANKSDAVLPGRAISASLNFISKDEGVFKEMAIQLVMDVAHTSANIVRLLYHRRERRVKGFASQLRRSFGGGAIRFSKLRLNTFGLVP